MRQYSVKYVEICASCAEEHVFDPEKFYDKNGYQIDYKSTE